MLSRIKKKLFDIKVTLFFYYFLYKRGVLREFIRACKDNNQGHYEGVLHRLYRGIPYEYLIMQSFSFARQMYVLHSNTDWWEISYDWAHSELFRSKKSK